MESWPISVNGVTFSLVREKDVVKKVMITFFEASIDHAPTITSERDTDRIPTITIPDSGYLKSAIQRLLNWQTIVSGLQIFDIDFDSYEMRFHPENFSEEEKILIPQFRGSTEELNESCDFEQIGRAFCAGDISPDRIESTSHYREGRLALQAGRNIDAYNNMYLFLESRYCDGKTGTQQQVSLLSHSAPFINALHRITRDRNAIKKFKSKHTEMIFNQNLKIEEKIKEIVELRGKLRHHSLKSPHRWDPNQQGEYQYAAGFLSSVVSDIVIDESLEDIYAPDNLKKFRSLSVEAGFETKLTVQTYRLNREPMLQANMSLPTTVLSSNFCKTALMETLKLCEKSNQIGDTTKIDAVSDTNDLELFTAELGIWAYAADRSIPIKGDGCLINCEFEHFRYGRIVKDKFPINLKLNVISIENSWKLLSMCLDRIEESNPTTRVMCLKLFIKKNNRPIMCYRVGSQITN